MNPERQLEAQPSLSGSEKASRSIPTTELHLIAEAQHGDRGALERLVNAYQPHVKRFVCARVDSREDAADVCQEVLLLAYRSLPHFKGHCGLLTWLFAIACTAIARYYRRRVPVLEYVEAEHAISRSPSRICDARQRIGTCLNCILTHLPLQQQIAILLVEVFGFDNRAAARQLRQSPRTLRRSLHEARKTLQQACGRPCAVVAKTGIPKDGVSPKPTSPRRKATGHGSRRLLRLRSRLLQQILSL